MLMNNSELIFNLISSMNNRVSFNSRLIEYSVHFYAFSFRYIKFLNNFYTNKFLSFHRIIYQVLRIPLSSIMIIIKKFCFFYDFILVYFIICFDNFSTYISAHCFSFWILSFLIMTE